MNYPEDRRNKSWDDGTANQPESDYAGWQAYPDSQPLPDQPTQQYPTQQYSTEQYGYPQQQYGQPHPTQALPPYDPNQHYQANQQYQATQQYPGYQQHPGYQPPPGPDGSGSGRKWMVAAVALTALLVVVLAGVLFLTNQQSGPSNTASPTTALPLPRTQAPVPSTPSPLAPPTSPGGLVPGGIPEILGGSGAAIGTVTSIDASSLQLDGIDGAPVTVVVTPQTQILSLSGFDLSALKVGSLVVVNGSPMQDGSITADIIVETLDGGN